MAAPDSTIVSFTLPQARRIAAAVRAHEKTLKSAVPGLEEWADARRHPNPLFAVKVEIDGGAAGSATTNCTFTYKVTTLAGTELGTGLTPDQRRFPNCPYTVTPPGSRGLGYFNENGGFALWSANELPQTTDCP